MDYLDQTLVGKLSKSDKAMPLNEASKRIEHLKNWQLIHKDGIGLHIMRVFKFDDTDKARAYITELKEIAEEMHSIPTIQLKGTEVRVECHTPQLKGIHRNDLIMAAQADELYDRWDIITGERDKVTEASDESFPASDPPGY